MGFFSRLFGTGKDAKDTQSASEMGMDAQTAAAILAEIDIDTAIAAHENWKQRLLNYVNGQSKETLDPEVICMDHRCDLGKWLHGAGSKRLKHYPAFGVLIARHKYFHVQASNVVALAQGQKKDEAMKLIEGAYTHGSTQTLILLRELKRGLTR